MRTIAAALACLLFALAHPAPADTIVMKNGERIEGRVIAVVGDQSCISLSTGKTKIVPSADIDKILKVAEVEITKAPPLPPLENSIARTLGVFAHNGEKSGVIVTASRDKFYVNLGAADGVLPGDQLEVLGAAAGERTPRDRRVAGLLKITSVQDKLSVCRLISGSAEGKNKTGEYNTVMPSSAGRKVCLGEMSAEPGADVDPSTLSNAVSTALGGAVGLQLADPADADFQLAARAAPADGGVTFLLQMVDLRSKRFLIENRGFHRTSFTAEDLAFPTVVYASLGTRLDIGPVRKALEKRFEKAYVAGPGAFATKVSSEGEAAWVFPDGRLAVASRNQLAERRNLLKLCQVWADVAGAVGGVTASIPSEGLDVLLWRTAEFHTLRADQFQYLYVEQLPTSFTDWVLEWPDSKQSWGLFLREAGPYYGEPAFTLDAAKQPHRYPGTSATDLAALAFGRHLLNGSNLSKGWITIEAFFPEPNGHISLCDKSGNAVATRTVFSRPTAEFFVPQCEVYTTHK